MLGSNRDRWQATLNDDRLLTLDSDEFQGIIENVENLVAINAPMADHQAQVFQLHRWQTNPKEVFVEIEELVQDIKTSNGRETLDRIRRRRVSRQVDEKEVPLANIDPDILNNLSQAASSSALMKS